MVEGVQGFGVLRVFKNSGLTSVVQRLQVLV